jgi:uncharacterized protein (TIGR02117 family)
MNRLRNQIILPLCAVVTLLVSCHTLPRAIVPTATELAEPKHRIHVANHGWHTGIILRREHLNRFLPALEQRFPNAEFYEIGWGDAGFYQTSRISAKTTLNAVFLPSDTVVHLAGIEADPVRYFSTSQVSEVKLSDQGMENLGWFLSASFARDECGNPHMLGPGLYGDSQFYRGEGKYHLFNGCNKWTAKALSSGGVRINPLWKITSASVMDEIGVSARTSRDRMRYRQGARGF